MATVTSLASRSGSAAAVGHLALQSPPAALNEDGVFAFARIHNDVCLVQTDASLANLKTPFFLTPVELAVFRHEFGTMFRLTRRATLPACDVQVLAPLDNTGLLCDADAGVVFLSREMTNQLLRYTAPPRVHTSLRSRRRY